MAVLAVFNASHDYALAHGGRHYMAPASINQLEKKLQWLPIVWAGDNCLILSPDNIIYGSKDNRPVSTVDMSVIENVDPWGWNKTLLERLKNCGIKNSVLPSEENIENLRRLSHRRISIKCNEFLESPSVPSEFFTLEQAIEFARKHKGCYFKMPWSSGGRGVLATHELDLQRIEEWIKGGLRRQQSVMGEIGIDRKFDFATLWTVTERRKAEFEGFSISLSDGRGKYDGNFFGSQLRIKEIIDYYTGGFPDTLLQMQQQFIENEISPFYKGKIGIDMMVDKKGKLYPCVEINLRRTMGHVALDFSRLPSSRRMYLRNLMELPLIETDHE